MGNITLTYDIPMDNTTITIGLGGTVGCNVSWGDETNTSYAEEGLKTHTYVNSGTYIVVIQGTLTEFGSASIPSPNYITSCSNLNLSGLTSVAYAFNNCYSLTSVPSSISTSITNTSYLFNNCISFNQDVSGWDVSNVSNMEGMFNGCFAFNQNLNSWIVSNVSNMSALFSVCYTFNEPLNSWNTSSVTNMSNLFSGCNAFNQELNGWDVSNVINMSYMFQRCNNFNQSLASWDVSNVESFQAMFNGCTLFNQSLSSWTPTSLTNIRAMFLSCTNFNQPLNIFNIPNITDINYTLNNCTSFNQSLASWDVSNVTSMEGTLYNTGLSVENYSNTLIAWNNLTVQNAVYLDATGLKYNNSGQIARLNLTNVHSWYIIDSGLACIFTNTKILVDDHNHKLIQDLKIGDDILTNEGIKKIKMIGYNNLHIKNINNFKVLPKSSFHENVPTDDLYISNGHSLMVTHFELENYKKNNSPFYHNDPKINDLYKLLASDCTLCNNINLNNITHIIENDFIKYYHIVIDDDREHKQFIIFANDMTIETISKVWYKKSNLFDVKK